MVTDAGWLSGVCNRMSAPAFHTVADALAAAAALLADAEPVDAVFADNNRTCVGVLHAIHERHGRRTVGMAAFDDIELAALIPHPVALVTYDATALGAHAAELLFARINGADGPPKRSVHRTTLVTRGGRAGRG
jgi:LacI family transcriptional regulator